jgi:hypothetical protein
VHLHDGLIERSATQVAALEAYGVHWIAPSLNLQIRQQQGTGPGSSPRPGRAALVTLTGVPSRTNLSEARDEAAELRSGVRRVIDLLSDRVAGIAKVTKAKVPTFAQCATQYIEVRSRPSTSAAQGKRPQGSPTAAAG